MNGYGRGKCSWGMAIPHARKNELTDMYIICITELGLFASHSFMNRVSTGPTPEGQYSPEQVKELETSTSKYTDEELDKIHNDLSAQMRREHQERKAIRNLTNQADIVRNDIGKHLDVKREYAEHQFLNGMQLVVDREAARARRTKTLYDVVVAERNRRNARSTQQ